MVCSVDLETGITKEKAENYLGMRFSNHPVTGVALEGFEIPKWHEVLGLVFDMAKVYELNYVAWDIEEYYPSLSHEIVLIRAYLVALIGDI